MGPHWKEGFGGIVRIPPERRPFPQNPENSFKNFGPVSWELLPWSPRGSTLGLSEIPSVRVCFPFFRDLVFESPEAEAPKVMPILSGIASICLNGLKK